VDTDQLFLSPFQGWANTSGSIQWFRTPLRFVLHHWLPYVAPLARLNSEFCKSSHEF